MLMTEPTPYRSTGVLLASAVWLAAAIALGVSGIPQRLPFPVPQLILLSLTGLLLLATFRLPRLRAWAYEIDARWLVALHLSRFVGFYFLVLYGRGELSQAFAVTAGWGDNLVASLALLLLLLGPPTIKGRWSLYLIWNVIGLADILFVVASAARIGMSDPQSIRALLKLPLSLLPTFLVPLIIASHVVLFARLARIRKGVADSANAA
jgi:hypothetical protein